MNLRLAAIAFAVPLLCVVSCSSEPAPVPVSAEPPAPPAPPPTAEPPSPRPMKKNVPVATPTVLASGTIDIPKGSKAAGKLVFVSLKGVGGRGPPIAAQRLPAGPFPMSFELTDANVVAMGGQKRPVPETFVLKVTLDADGNPMQKTAGDYEIIQQMKKGTKAKLMLAPRK